MTNKTKELTIKKKKFIKRTSPAVTRVLLCTRALTGVGALIAFGNQLLKGNWALFVNPLKKKKKRNTPKKTKLLNPKEKKTKKKNKQNNKKSPKRFVKETFMEPTFLSQLL
jgi:hypothetical protein